MCNYNKHHCAKCNCFIIENFVSMCERKKNNKSCQFITHRYFNDWLCYTCLNIEVTADILEDLII
jgi:hypothetical protein